jgi:hypothetical protein
VVAENCRWKRVEEISAGSQVSSPVLELLFVVVVVVIVDDDDDDDDESDISQINTVHVLPAYYVKIHFNIILKPKPVLS